MLEQEYIYQLEQISLKYETNKHNFVQALYNINLNIIAGERWSIIGPSGCGKSSLLYLLSGLLQPTSGKLIYKNNNSLRPNNEIAVILQDYGLFPWKTVFENVALGLKLQKIKSETILDRVEKILVQVGIKEQANKFPAQLSGGQKQRVAIARSLVLKPKVLLMDEPFSALDAITKNDLKEFLLDICQKEGLTLIFVTHNIEEAVQVGNKILIFGQEPGKIVKVLNNDLTESAARTENFYQTCEQLKTYLGINQGNEVIVHEK